MKKISLVLVAAILISVLSVVPKGKDVEAYSIDYGNRDSLYSGYQYEYVQVGDEIKQGFYLSYEDKKNLMEDLKLMISLDDESHLGTFSPKIIELSSDDYSSYGIIKDLDENDYISESDPDGKYIVSLIDSDNNTIISSHFTDKNTFGLFPASEVRFYVDEIIEAVVSEVGMCPTTSHNINDAVAIGTYEYDSDEDIMRCKFKFTTQPIGQYDIVAFDHKGKGTSLYESWTIYTDDKNQLEENNINFTFTIKEDDYNYVYAYAYDSQYKDKNSSTYPILYAEDKTTPITSFDAFGTAKNPDGDTLYVYRLNILDKSKFTMTDTSWDFDCTYAYSKINGGILDLYRDSSGYGIATIYEIGYWDLEPKNPFPSEKEDDQKEKDIKPTPIINNTPTPAPETKKNVSVSSGGITKVNTSSNGTATLTGVNKKSKKITVGSVKVGGFKYPITAIAKNSFKNTEATDVTVKFSKKNITIKKDAFKNSKVKTLSFKSFTKASQIKMDKNSLKSSKIKTIKVSKKIFNNKKQKNAFKKTLKKAGLRNYKLKKI